jgi:hypothetical protein
MGFEGEIYTDPSLAAFRAFSLRRGLWATLNPYCSFLFELFGCERIR